MSQVELNDEKLINYLNESLIFNVELNSETIILNLEQFLGENKIFHLELVKDLIIKTFKEIRTNNLSNNINNKLRLFSLNVEENIQQYKEYYNKKLIKEILKYFTKEEIISYIFNNTIELNNNNNNFVEVHDFNSYLENKGIIFKEYIIDYIYNLCLEYICDNNLEFFVFVPEKIKNKIKIKFKSHKRIERRNIIGTKRNIVKLINEFIINFTTNDTKFKDLKTFYLKKLPIEINNYLRKNKNHKKDFYNLILDIKFYFTDKLRGKTTQIYTSLREQFDVYGIIGDDSDRFIDDFLDIYIKMIIDTLDDDTIVNLNYIESCFINTEYIKNILTKSKLDYKFMEKLLKELKTIIKSQTITRGRKVIYPKPMKNIARTKYKNSVYVGNLPKPKGNKSPFTKQPRGPTKRKTGLRQVTTVKDDIKISDFAEIDLNKFLNEEHKKPNPVYLIDVFNQRLFLFRLAKNEISVVTDILYKKIQKIISQFSGKTKEEKIENFYKIFLGLKGANNTNHHNYRALHIYIQRVIRNFQIIKRNKILDTTIINKNVHESEIYDFNTHENFILKNKKLLTKKHYTTSYFNNNLTQKTNVLPENKFNTLVGFKKSTNGNTVNTGNTRVNSQRISTNNPRQ